MEGSGRFLTDPICADPGSLRVVDGAGPTLQGSRRRTGMLDLLMVILTLVSFAVFVALVAWLERV